MRDRGKGRGRRGQERGGGSLGKRGRESEKKRNREKKRKRGRKAGRDSERD